MGLRMNMFGTHPTTMMSALAAIAVSNLMSASVNAQGTQGFDATRPWINCLVEKSRTLSKSPDSAPIVASAVITLCQDLDGPARLASEHSAAENMVRDGAARDDAEAQRIVRSVRDRGWTAYLAIMTEQVAAIVVQMRAGPVQR